MKRNIDNHGIIHKVEILDHENAQFFADKVVSISNLWLTRMQYFNTLGAVTYLEAFNEKGVLSFNELGTYHCHKSLMNPVLQRHFSPLYKKLCSGLDKHLDSPCELNLNLAHPGFHIYGATALQGQMHQEFIDSFTGDSWSHLHVDIQYLPHLPIWDQYSDVDFINPMSFTLTLQLPESGSALRHWNSIESIEDAKLFNYMSADEKSRFLGEKKLALYEPGVLTYFIGHLIHQIPAANPLKVSDRRITLQGHGIKCDGVWQLYF